MIETPEYVKVGDKKYKINTSYKVALKCDKIIKDNSIKDYEKTLAIIYLLFGKEALKDKNHQNKLIELAFKYLSCGEEVDGERHKPDMSFEQDFKLIVASFKSDLGVDLLKEDIDWWTFWTYINGLKEDCILNRVRELRNMDPKEIKDSKERKKVIDAQKRWALKDAIEESNLTKEQEESMNALNKIVFGKEA